MDPTRFASVATYLASQFAVLPVVWHGLLLNGSSAERKDKGDRTVFDSNRVEALVSPMVDRFGTACPPRGQCGKSLRLPWADSPLGLH